MTLAHPLDRPAWSALTSSLSSLALRQGAAVRLDPSRGVFIAADAATPEALADMGALARAHPGSGLFEREGSALDRALPPGFAVGLCKPCVQMTAAGLTAAGGPDEADVVELGEADADDMADLALLTQPGPWRADTWRLGDFIGVRREGRLIAMAGQRLRLPGFVEVSAVCTHPEARGQGLAGRLTRIVADRILAGGDTAFLHAAADNAGAIRLYESLGFRARARIVYAVLEEA